MKVNNESKATISIGNLSVGQTFSALRKGKIKNEDGSLVIGYYMKVDKSSGFYISLSDRENLAVNLETGQLRKFDKDCRVTEISVECNVMNN